MKENKRKWAKNGNKWLSVNSVRFVGFPTKNSITRL